MDIQEIQRPIVARDVTACVSFPLGPYEYICNWVNVSGAITTTGTFTAGTLYAMPFVSPPRNSVLRRIACEVTTASSGENVRLGLYNNMTDDRDVYPGSLIADGGSVLATTTGVKSFGMIQELKPGKIYWVVLNCSANIVCRGLAVGQIGSILGMASAATTALNAGITVASAFGAMPDPFPSSGTYITAVPVPQLRYAFAT